MKIFVIRREKLKDQTFPVSWHWYRIAGGVCEPRRFEDTTGLKLKPGEQVRVRLVLVKK